MCAEATDNMKNHTAVLPLTLALSQGRRNCPAIVSVANILPGGGCA